MLSFVKAMSPPPMNTSRPSTMIGRRVSPNASRPFSTGYTSIRPGDLSARCRGKRIAQEQRSLGGGQLTRLHALEDLPVAFALQSDRDRPPGEAAAVGGDPYDHGAVAFPDHPVEWNCGGTHGVAGADHEVREHAGPQFVPRIPDLGPDQDAARGRIDHRPDGGDLPVELAVRKGADLDRDRLLDAERRAVGLSDVRQ